MKMNRVNEDGTTRECQAYIEHQPKSIAISPTFPSYSDSTELVVGDRRHPVYRELYAEKHWTEVPVETRCKYYAEKLSDFRRKTGQEQRGPVFDKWDIIEHVRCNSVRIKKKEYEVVRNSYVYPESPWMIHDDPQGTEAMRLGLVATKPAPEISSSSGMKQSVLPTSSGAISTCWLRKMKLRFKRKPKQRVIHKDLALCDLDEEALKEKFLVELKKRKSFPTVLTYRIPFLKAFRPKTQPENKYSPMEIPEEVYERYFRGQNPWDYGGSPLPFWTPPKV